MRYCEAWTTEEEKSKKVEIEPATFILFEWPTKIVGLLETTRNSCKFRALSGFRRVPQGCSFVRNKRIAHYSMKP